VREPDEDQPVRRAEAAEPFRDPVEMDVQRAAGVIDLVGTTDQQQRAQVFESAHLTPSGSERSGPERAAQIQRYDAA
jgi:hypothetical protein